MKAQTKPPVRSMDWVTTAVCLVAVVLLWGPLPASSLRANSGEPHLSMLIDLPLPGQPSRFDYQSFDPESKRLYFSHMGDGELLIVSTETRELVGRLSGFPRATGVLVVPELEKVFISVP